MSEIDDQKEQLVENKNQIIENIETLHCYSQSSEKELTFFKERIKAGANFVIHQIGGELFFAPSKFVGYKNNDTSHAKISAEGFRDGRDTDKRITEIFQNSFIKQDVPEHQKWENAFQDFCKKHSIIPNDKDRKYWPPSNIAGAY